MNPINLRVNFIDGTSEEVTALAVDLIAFEAHFDKSVASMGKEVRLTHLFFLAYNVLRRAGKTGDDSFEKWAESVSMVMEASGK